MTEELTKTIIHNAATVRINRDLVRQSLQHATASQHEFLAQVLAREVNLRERNKRRRLISAAHIPVIKTFADYHWSNINFPADFNQDDLTSLSFADNAEDLVLYGDVGCGKTHLATAIIHQACTRGIPARFTTAAGLVTTLRKAKREGHLEQQLATLKKHRILAIDELGYLPIDPEGTHLLFPVTNDAYEHHSLVITTNVKFSRWGTISSDDTVAATVLDRIIHHGRILRFTSKSWRLTHALMT